MPQVRLRPPSRDEQLKLKTNPFAPVAYTKYSHLLIDSHMHNHSKRILTARPRIDMGTPDSAVKCVKTRAKYYSPARIDLILDTSICSDSSIGSLGMSGNLYKDYDEFKMGDFNCSKGCITKTGKQTKFRNKKETNKSTPIPWKHTTKSECLGQKTNFPSLVSSVCASQLVTIRQKRNVKYKHVKSKVKQIYFDKKDQQVKPTPEINKSSTDSEYSSDPDHQSEQSDEELNLSHITTGGEERNVNLGETFNLNELQISRNDDTKISTEMTSPELCAEVPTETMRLSELEPEPILDSAPEAEFQFDLDLEYLKLKRSITEECVKLQIFTSAAILKVCERMTGSRSGLDPEQVSKMIGQILRELEID